MEGLAADSAGSSPTSYWPIVVLGGLAMLVLAVLQYRRFTLGGLFSTSFMKAYGLILVATLGAVLAFAEVSDGARTGAYTLLGTIAGYLAGTRSPDQTSRTVLGGGAAGTSGGTEDGDEGTTGDTTRPGGADSGSHRGIREEPLG